MGKNRKSFRYQVLFWGLFFLAGVAVLASLYREHPQMEYDLPSRLYAAVSWRSEDDHGRIMYVAGRFFIFSMGLIGFFLFLSDRRERRLLELDSVSMLPNLPYFCRLVQKLLNRHPGERFAILLFDLEGYSRDKDLLGFESEERVYSELGRMLLEKEKQEKNTVYGIMGDAILLCRSEKELDEDAICHWMWEVQRELFGHNAYPIRMGICSIDGTAEKTYEYCERALIARRAIAGNGEEQWERYEPAMIRERREELELMRSVAEALERGEFVPWLQPQVDYITGTVTGAEVLCRWKQPDGKIVGPGAFIPAFERSDRVFELDMSIWRQTCALLAAWKEKGLDPPSLSVNISRRDVYHEDLPELLADMLTEYGLDPSELHLEITETGFMENPRQLTRVVQKFRLLGFSVEMDDFGSGYSSLGALKELPVNAIKLDMSLVQEAEEGQRSGSILVALVRMIHQLDLPVVAEGVETFAQAEFLKTIGCDIMQGYYFYKPMDPESFEQLLSSREEKSRVLPQIFTHGVDKAANFLNANTQEALLFNSFVGGACIAELRHRQLQILRSNDRLYEVLGVRRDMWMRMTTTGAIDLEGESGEAFFAMLRQAIESGKEAECEFRDVHLHPGEELWLRVRARCLAQKQDSYIFYCDFENITEKHELMKTNSQLLSEVERVVENMPYGIARFRFDGDALICEFMNHVYHEMLGYTKAELRGMLNADNFSVVYPEDKAHVTETTRLSLEKEENFAASFRLIRKDGSILPVTVTASYVRDERGRFLYVSCAEKDSEKIEKIENNP